MSLNIFALHGFLGHPTNWDTLALPHLISVDLYKDLPHPKEGLTNWAKAFNEKIPNSAHNVLLGYSLGGRLAMHALLSNPEKWSAGVLISAHPGLSNIQERAQRRDHDEKWARRFEQENFESVIHDWEEQPVFTYSKPLPRNKEKREHLAAMLRGWSLGQQENLLPKLATLNLPLYWVAGEQDKKYAAILNDVKKAIPSTSAFLIPNAGHRVPWDNREAFAELTQNLSLAKQDFSCYT